MPPELIAIADEIREALTTRNPTTVERALLRVADALYAIQGHLDAHDQRIHVVRERVARQGDAELIGD